MSVTLRKRVLVLGLISLSIFGACAREAATSMSGSIRGNKRSMITIGPAARITMTSPLTTAFLFKRVRTRRRQDIGLREIATKRFLRVHIPFTLHGPFFRT